MRNSLIVIKSETIRNLLLNQVNITALSLKFLFDKVNTLPLPLEDICNVMYLILMCRNDDDFIIFQGKTV